MPFFPPFFGFRSFFVLNIPILSPIIYNWTLIIIGTLIIIYAMCQLFIIKRLLKLFKIHVPIINNQVTDYKQSGNRCQIIYNQVPEYLQLRT